MGKESFDDLFISIRMLFNPLSSPVLTFKAKLIQLWQSTIKPKFKAEDRFTRYYYKNLLNEQLGLGREEQLQVENAYATPLGILVFYHLNAKSEYVQVWCQLFESAQVDHALWHKPKLIMEIGKIEAHWQFLSLIKTDCYRALWRSPSLGVKEFVYPNYLISNEIELRYPMPKLQKPLVNPMIVPNQKNSWEEFCTFNPAAVYAADKVHILYRAQGNDYVSKIGYANSDDGLNISKRFSQPIYVPTQVFEGVSLPPGDPNNPFVSGGGCGGCEDPRATIINDRLYMTYVAYNGWDCPRVAITSIALTDFLNERFLWEKPVLITSPDVVDKSACLFPEKINGKYVIMHRVFPDILIDYVDSLDFNGETFLSGQYKISPRTREWWDSRKIGAGAPPLKTDEGWLLIYQAVDDKDASQYKVGAMLLDLNDPSKVLYRSVNPILEPQESYENAGFKSGVVYPCGAVIRDETLFVYYGGSDSYVCVATANLKQFLQDLIKTSKTALDSGLFILDL